ncbi:MAG: glycoside hydrolase family 13 protein [Chitinophagales bacterium]|nr:glycoside hydrolase family 13 protein [Chitinophagales bacterium]MDW8394157.1 glycoside hydrolase family 13 protein [Chitinophagales bacterium]
MPWLLLRLVALLILCTTAGGSTPIRKVQPAFWYAGMKQDTLQVMVYGEKMAQWKVAVSGTAVELLHTRTTENPNYLFVYLSLRGAPAQTCTLTFTQGKKKMHQLYELRSRSRKPEEVQGFNASDVMYLLFPDRFANGDPTNDVLPSLKEKAVNRNQPAARHGGDLQGIINHLDYLADLGITCLWLNPVLINDQPAYSYHGYAATDLYEVDPRLGSNELYAALVAKAHEYGIKVIQDVIYNHIGNEHFLIRDPVSSAWVNQWEQFTRCNYRPSSLIDPYAAAADVRRTVAGWFDTHMPDLNQTDTLLADYLIQNTIWWIEYARLDGLRIDTYPYPYPDFMNRLVRRVKTEYPNISMVGEVWDQTINHVAWFQHGSPLNRRGSELDYLFDFNLYYAIRDGLREPFGWTTGLTRIYYTLAQDFVYGDPYKLVTFLDNHDVSRIYSELGGDFNKWKQAVTLLLTLRGIPCIYYGTELLFSGFANPDGLVRQDFPGGWPGDAVNKFAPAGRSEQEQEAFLFVRRLIEFRKNYPVMQTGKMRHFVPENDVYVFCRYDNRDVVVVAINTSAETKTLDPGRYGEVLHGYRQAVDVLSGALHADVRNLQVGPQGCAVFLLRK